MRYVPEVSGLFDVITVGSNTLDVFVTTDAELVKVSIHENQKKHGRLSKEECLVYPLGAKILINELSFEIGGGGTNTAVSFSRLGLSTGYLGKIGHDNSGMQVFNLLHKEKVDFLGNFGKQTGYSVILDSKVKDRTILTFKGCNDDFRYSQIDKNLLKTKWFYFCSMTNSSYEVLEKLSGYAQKKGIKIAFNPSRYLALKGLSFLDGILKNTNVLILNKEEAKLLSGAKDMNGAFETLKKHAKYYVVITDGDKGSYCFDGKSIIHAPARRDIKIVETTGAGDAFASAFTAGIINGHDAQTCVRMGMLQAESVIQYKGAKNILLSKKEMEKAMNADKRKRKITITKFTR